MVTPEQIQQAIRSVTDQRSFIDGLLRQTLNWPIDLDFDNIGEITYELTDQELDTIGLSRDVLTGPVLEMQPLEQTNQQPWGIFILEFANPIPLLIGRGLTGPLRKVLRGLVSNRRNRPSNLPIWDRKNLLFIRTITVTSVSLISNRQRKKGRLNRLLCSAGKVAMPQNCMRI